MAPPFVSRASEPNPVLGGGERIANYGTFLNTSQKALMFAKASLSEEDFIPKASGAVSFDGIGQLLSAPGALERLPLSRGLVRLEDGSAFVTARTVMPGVWGPMLQWWFTWIDAGYKYVLWHPEDHVWCEMVGDSPVLPNEERRPVYEIGRTHVVVEHIGKAQGHPAEDANVAFVDPREFGFRPELFDAAGIRFVIAARAAIVIPIGELAAVYVAHVAFDHRGEDGEIDGVELRSFFWLGGVVDKLSGPSFPPSWFIKWVTGFPLVKRLLLSDAKAATLVRHAHEEFHTLAAVLPALFKQEAASHWQEMLPAK